MWYNSGDYNRGIIPTKNNKNDIYSDILKESHILIAGCTGSGKSVTLHGLIYKLLCRDSSKIKIIFIDPKRLELTRYKNTPHCVSYANDFLSAVRALDAAVRVMNERLLQTERIKRRMYPGSDLYIVIDEFADLMQENPKAITERITKIGRLGRAARVHLILATQSPNRRVIPAEILQNITCVLALRCRSAIESRQVIGCSGAEKLPRFGYGLYLSPEVLEPVKVHIPKIPESDIYKRLRELQQDE